MTLSRNDRTGRRAAALAFVLAPLLVLGLAPAGHSQGPGPAQGPQQPRDPLAEHLFPPDLVMRHQAEIGLSASQREAIIKTLQRAQGEMVPLQFEASEASEALAELLSGSRVDEDAALAQAQRVMELETRVRARHLALLIGVKNLLTPEQQERLRAIRGSGR